MLDDCLLYLCVLLVSKKKKKATKTLLNLFIFLSFNSILVRGFFFNASEQQVVQWSLQLVTSGSILVVAQEKLVDINEILPA